MPFDGKNISSNVRRLIAARTYLLSHGWCQGKPEDDNGRVCIIGALRAITPIHSVAPTELMDILWAATLVPQETRELALWNDDPIRTIYDVIKVFDRAIEAEVLKET